MYMIRLKNMLLERVDFHQMATKIVKDAGYTGFVGVEYEGDELNESKGIKATKDLLLSVATKLK